MNYYRIARINRCGFTRATIALIIEMAVCGRHDYKSIARVFGCSDKTVAMYVNKYYYGTVNKGVRTITVTRPSRMNDDMRKEVAA